MRTRGDLQVSLVIFAMAVCWAGPGPRADDVTLDWSAERIASSYQARVDQEGFIYSVTGVYLLKLDLDGNELWARALDSVGGYRSVGYRLAIDPEGNVFVIGTNTAIPNAFLTMKYDPDGNQLWEEIMPDTGTPVRVETDAAGNAYVLGWTRSSLPDFVTGKYDPDGNLLWRNVFAGGVINEAAGMAVTTAGEVAVAGRSNVVGNAYDTSVVVYDTDGNERWWRNHSSAIPGGGTDRGTSVAFGPAGEVYVGGSCEHNEADWDTTLIKYDADGNEQWVRHHNFNPGPNHYDSILWIGVDSAGNVLTAGQSDGSVVALKYDADGNLLWVRQHDGGDGGENYVLHMVVGPYDDAMYISGLNALRKTLAIKYDADGNLRWTFLHTYGGFSSYYGTSIEIDPGNNVVLGKYGYVMFHLLQADCTLGPPTEVNGVTVALDRVAWLPGSNGEQYDVARGDLGLLTNGGLLECTVTDTAQTSCVDEETPMPGETLVYLVRPDNVCGIGEWGTGTNGDARVAICP